jgi:hypothetical protein
LTNTALSCLAGRAHTDEVPDDASWTDPVVVPDDIRALQADIDAYHRELRLQRRRRRWRWLTGAGTGPRLALPAAGLAGSLAVAAIVVNLVRVGTPGGTQPPRAVPVASHPAAAVGSVGGLLPNATVGSVGSIGAGYGDTTRRTSIRALRPAVVALVPAHCGCSTLLGQLAAQADESQLPLVVVAPAADAEVDVLPGQLHRGVVLPVHDASGVLARTYAAQGVTVLTVAPDATVGYVARNVVAGTRFELAIQQTLRLTALSAR